HSGARIWMHNNFLIDRRGKMSKSAGDFLRLQTLVDRGFHPLAYRLMCLQAHYRSELEFSWEGLQAASVRLKRLVMALETLRSKPVKAGAQSDIGDHLAKLDTAVSEDFNTSAALVALDDMLASPLLNPERDEALKIFDAVLGLGLATLTRSDLRIRPVTATITETEIEATLTARRDARTARDFARSDALRDDLAAAGVEVMDGDPLGWDWRPEIT
ncbi:MAG: cysteine--tRNA ligase, partial [Sphingomonas sp.]|nr:cysteine--tRNA ligase [Sphingomonas sp.]